MPLLRRGDENHRLIVMVTNHDRLRLELNPAQAAQELADYLRDNELTAKNYKAVQSLFHSVSWMGEGALKLC